MAGKISRRRVLSAAGATGAFMFVPTIWNRATAEDRRIVVRDTGVGTAFMDAFAKPFKEATGIEAVPVLAQHEPTGLVKQMVDSKTYTWDMALLSNQAATQLVGEKGGYLEPLDIDGAESYKALPDAFKTRYFAGNDVVASVLAYRTDRVKTIPKSWADLWNVDAFPGARALRRFPQETLEYALMADGVDPGRLYPLDVDRAFKSLDRIKGKVAVWWTSGAQTAQLLQSAEVDYCTTWNGRVQAVRDGGVPVAIMWEQAIWGWEGWTILKGTPKADLCREFVKFALLPERQAVFANLAGYGPTQPEALKHVSAERAQALPTSPTNVRNPVYTDARYWAENTDALVERFNRWMLA